MATVASRGETLSFSQLSATQERHFEELQGLLDHQESNLDWYFRAGRQVQAVRKSFAERGPGWLKWLAKELDQSPSNLTKMRQFAEHFTGQEAHRLHQQGCTWGMITVV